MILRQLWCGIFLRQIAGLCVFSGCRWRTRTLCIRQTLCRRDNWYSDSDFCCFDCLLTVSDDWYTVGIVLVDLWRLVHQWLFLLLTVFDDWYTVGTVLVDLWRLVQQRWFLLFWLSFDCFWRLVHCWYSLGRPVMIGTPMVIFAVDCFWQLVHCWYSLGRPVMIGTPIVLTVFDDWCSVPIVKNSKNDYWCTSRHMSTKTVPTVYQSSRGVGSGEGCSPPQKFFCIFLFQNGDFLCMPVWISVWYFLQFRVMPQAVY